MILDDHHDRDDTHELDDDADLDEHVDEGHGDDGELEATGEWFGGLRRAGLPVLAHDRRPTTSLPNESAAGVSPALRDFLTETTPVAVSAELRTLLQSSIAPSTRAEGLHQEGFVGC